MLNLAQKTCPPFSTFGLGVRDIFVRRSLCVQPVGIVSGQDVSQSDDDTDQARNAVTAVDYLLT